MLFGNALAGPPNLLAPIELPCAPCPHCLFRTSCSNALQIHLLGAWSIQCSWPMTEGLHHHGPAGGILPDLPSPNVRNTCLMSRIMVGLLVVSEGDMCQVLLGNALADVCQSAAKVTESAGDFLPCHSQRGCPTLRDLHDQANL